MKKIFSIVLALVLVLSLSLATVTSVAATVHDISVTPDPNTVGTAANYTIVFNIIASLQTGETISIKFPDDTTVPPTGYETGDITVQSTDQSWNVSHGDISVVGREVTIGLKHGIGAESEVTVVFKEGAGIKNPTTQEYYTLYVKTCQEPTWAPSDPYYINLADKSTYEFVYQPEPEDMMIWRDEAAGVNVTLQTLVGGLHGYNSTLILFNVTKAPPDSEVTFQVYDGDEWQLRGVDSGNWTPPDDGYLDAVYSETFPFRLTFKKVGVYTIKFVLDNLTNGDIEVDEINFAVTGVSVPVPLDTGWNLMSLPVVPDDSTIAAVLASIEEDFISVHYYDATTEDWLIYSVEPYFDSLTDMKDGKAYWINMRAAANLTVVGQAIAAPGGSPPPTYPVVEGWNMVGFKSMENMAAKDYLMGTEIVRIYGFDGGWFSLPYDYSNNMTPGLGYWVAFSEDGTIYP
jgi:hypothetical protein